LDKGRGKFIGRKRNQGAEKIRMIPDVLFKLVTVPEDRLESQLPKVLLGLDIKVGFFDSNLKRD